MKIDPIYFDINNPILPTAETYIGDYDKKYFDDKNDFEFLCKVSLIRNGQFIGKIPLPDLKISSSRGNGELLNELYSVRAELSYEPISCNDNEQDICIGIQENKTQFNGEDVPINLTRLIRYLKKKKSDEIWTYFKNLSEPQYQSGTEQELEPENQNEHVLELEQKYELENQLELEQEPENQCEKESEPEQKYELENQCEKELEQEPENQCEKELEPEQENQQEPESEPINPINVLSYRRGGVIGKELITELERIINNIDPFALYNEEYIRLFNMCKSL